MTDHINPLPLSTQVALVTGGGSGIGRAIAQALAAAGATVVVAGRTQEHLDETVDLIRSREASAHAVLMDVTNKQTVPLIVRQIEERFGSIDILVNNAGLHRALGPLWTIDPDMWWQEVETNLLGTFLCMHTVLPGMVERRHGRIINISSAAGNQPRPYSTAYSSSKAAVTRLTESVALSTKEYGVYLFALHPGAVRTAMADYLTKSEPGKRWVPEFEAVYDQTEIPPERVAQLTVLLASGAGDRLSGQFLNVYDDIHRLIEHSERE